MLCYVRLYALISPGWWVHEFVIQHVPVKVEP